MLSLREGADVAAMSAIGPERTFAFPLKTLVVSKRGRPNSKNLPGGDDG